jgi:uncharacterized membrane protein YbhN (UPF0104 family)
VTEQPPNQRRRRIRKLGGLMAVVMGLLLIVLERSEALGGAQQGVAWFWIVVGSLLVLLGLAELADRA